LLRGAEADTSSHMTRVLYFAACRERAGKDEESIDLDGRTVAEAVAVLGAAYPELAKILPHCRVAVNHAFVDEDHVIESGAELALIPPVAGGNVGPVRARVLETPLSIDAVVDRVMHSAAGAEVVMIGTVRDHAAGEGVESLRYEAYVPMAEKVIDSIVREVEAEFPGVRGAVDHRVGHLAIGERAVVVAASAPHRKDAFDAAQRIIDRLKEDAPIWKHERRTSGEIWVGLGP